MTTGKSQCYKFIAYAIKSLEKYWQGKTCQYLKPMPLLGLLHSVVGIDAASAVEIIVARLAKIIC